MSTQHTEYRTLGRTGVKVTPLTLGAMNFGARRTPDHDETLGALTDLAGQGKVRYVGTSTFLPGQIVEAQWVAEKRGRERPVTEQPPYSILARGVDRPHRPPGVTLNPADGYHPPSVTDASRRRRAR